MDQRPLFLQCFVLCTRPIFQALRQMALRTDQLEEKLQQNSSAGPLVLLLNLELISLENRLVEKKCPRVSTTYRQYKHDLLRVILILFVHLWSKQWPYKTVNNYQRYPCTAKFQCRSSFEILQEKRENSDPFGFRLTGRLLEQKYTCWSLFYNILNSIFKFTLRIS